MDWTSLIKDRLTPGEELLKTCKDLGFSVRFVPDVTPEKNYDVHLKGRLALTNLRLIILWAEGGGWKWLYIPVINSLSERPLRSHMPKWPYQAIVMIPGGMGLVIQTREMDKDHANEVSSILVEAFMRLGVRQYRNGTVSTMITEEE